jgi:arylsulfatase A-like enzyme
VNCFTPDRAGSGARPLAAAERLGEASRVSSNGGNRLRRAAGVAALLLAGAGCGPGPGSDPMGVVLITLDTTRADALGCYGQALVTSPHIDRMAAEGVLFAHAMSSAPSTLPSHATILTGKHPYAHGARSNSGYVLPEAHVTLAEVLQHHGYRTAAEVAAPIIGRRTQLGQGFDHYRSAPVGVLERDAAEITRRGIEFLEAQPDAKFLLWLHYFDPHAPYAPPAAFQIRRSESGYLAEILHVDHQIGRVLAALERLGLRKRTLLVLTADHGEGRGEHDEKTHSFFVYDTTLRVPLIFWGPDRLPAGARVESLVRTVDVAPTLLDLLGLPAPDGIQGVSLRPLLEGDVDDLGLVAYGESIEGLSVFGASVLRTVREGPWKYIHKVDPELYDVRSDPGELDNLAARHPETVQRLRATLRELIAAAPPAPAGAEAPLDAAARAQLEALGYLAGNAPAGLDNELAAVEVEGTDMAALAVAIQRHGAGLRAIREKRYQDASEIYRALWREHPQSRSILAKLIAAHRELGRDEQLRPLLSRAIELDPRSARHRVDLALLLRKDGDRAGAEEHLRAALALDACHLEAHIHLAELLRAERRYAERLKELEAGMQRCPDLLSLRNATAYALATCPDDALRDGPRALRLAEEAVAATHREHPDYLDTLAAAQAEVGAFEAAVATAQQALALLEGRDLPDSVTAAYREHLAAFEAGQPLRVP